MSYAAAYGDHNEAPDERQLRRDHPLRLRKTYEEPADLDERTGVRRWSLGVATGALLVAGTFAAGVLGLNDGAAPLATGTVPEYAPASPGDGDIGAPTAVSPPNDRHDPRAPAGQEQGAPAPVTAAPAPVANQSPLPPAAGSDNDSGGNSRNGGNNGNGSNNGDGAVARPAPNPAPAPAPAQESPGLVEGVTDTVGDVLTPVTGTVSGVLTPVTGVLSGGDQPALTMIDPLGDLLGS